MSGDVNVVRTAVEALNRRDFDLLEKMLDADVVWYATGDERVAGTYRGRDEVVQALRLAASRGDTELADLEVFDDPGEVSGFDFLNPQFNSPVINANVRGDCGKQDILHSSMVIGVQGGQISNLGSISGGPGFQV